MTDKHDADKELFGGGEGQHLITANNSLSLITTSKINYTTSKLII